MEIEHKHFWEQLVALKDKKINALLLEKFGFEKRISELTDGVKAALKIAERLEAEAMEREGYITQLNETIGSLRIKIAAHEEVNQKASKRAADFQRMVDQTATYYNSPVKSENEIGGVQIP